MPFSFPPLVSFLTQSPRRGKECHAPRVTEAGATPQNPVTHRASKGGVAPASSEFLPRSNVLPYSASSLLVSMTSAHLNTEANLPLARSGPRSSLLLHFFGILAAKRLP